MREYQPVLAILPTSRVIVESPLRSCFISTNCCAGIHLHYFTWLQFVSQWDRCSEVLSLWISNYKGTGEKKRVRRSLYNAVLQAGFPKVAVSLKVSLRFMLGAPVFTEFDTSNMMHSLHELFSQCIALVTSGVGLRCTSLGSFCSVLGDLSGLRYYSFSSVLAKPDRTCRLPVSVYSILQVRQSRCMRLARLYY